VSVGWRKRVGKGIESVGRTERWVLGVWNAVIEIENERGTDAREMKTRVVTGGKSGIR
jgi:hypothetical protein